MLVPTKSLCNFIAIFNSEKSVLAVQRNGKVCVLDIDVEGVKQLKNSELNPLLVFIMPPSIEELAKRLTERNTETAESLKKRLDAANREIEYGEYIYRELGKGRPTNIHFDFIAGRTPGNVDQIIENHDLKQAYEDLRQFIVSELEAQIKSGVEVDLTRAEIE